MSPSPKQFPFNKRAIESLPPQSREAGAREAEYSDTECIGLKCLVNRQGRKYFYYRYTHKKRRRAIKIGEFPATSVIDARRRCNDLRAQIDRGIDPQGERQKILSIPSFKVFALEHYMPYAENVKRSYKDDRSRLEHHLIPCFGHLALHEITTQSIQLFLADGKKKGLAPATINRLRSLVQRILALAVQWGYLERNPASGIPKFQENNQRQRFLHGHELQAFYRALEAESNRQAADFILLLLLTGARVGELLNSRHPDVDTTHGIWRVPLSKSGKTRMVILNDAAMAVFARQVRVPGNLYVFPGSPKYQNARMAPPQKAFERVKRTAGIEDLRLHDLRHSFASLAVGSGASLYDVQKLLGHSSPNMTQRYSHLADERLRHVSNSVSAAVSIVVSPEVVLESSGARLDGVAPMDVEISS
ncbi:tyrosine-type recombinase/integrase [Thiorhodococcus fuscus]|uniref:Tyrosine-type recombinase/integrase n=1 Tax=Thiorhodococcus fuscus TaxID=527200 RepID=A0ABW4Y5R8_9GAMM